MSTGAVIPPALEASSLWGSGQERRPTGVPGLDQRLPGGGLRPGSLVEIVDEGAGGAATLACLLARRCLGKSGQMVVLESVGRGAGPHFYPPAAAELGLDPQRLLVVQVQQARELLWGLEQTLRSPAVAVVCSWVASLAAVPARRLQLAAESGSALGLLLRPAAARGQPSWAEIRLAVRPIPSPQPQQPGLSRRRWLQLELLRARGTRAGDPWQVEIDADSVRLVPPLAHPTLLAGERPIRERRA